MSASVSDVTMVPILARAKVIGVPKYVSTAVLPLVSKWLMCSGEEWTVSRLKAVKVDLIHIKAGDEPVSEWISLRRKSKGLHFKGPLGVLERWMMQSTASFNKGIQFIQMYTSFFARAATPAQEKKFLTSVLSSPYPYDPEVVSQVVLRGLLTLSTFGITSRSGELRSAEPIMLMGSSPTKRAPLPGGISVPEQEGIIDSVSFLFGSPQGQVHYMKYRKLYDPVLVGLEDTIHVNWGLTFPHSDGVLEVGKIGLIQEPGYKLRAVANPGRIFQRVLEPLGDILFKYLKVLPWDCTFDQSKALTVVQEHLKFGKSAHCYDLSNATDLFPLSIQMDILHYLFPDSEYPGLFRDLARGYWYYGKRAIRWETGQPLGLYPSFASFALAHGIILLGLLGRPYAGQFYILGDDVVILDDELADAYYHFMVHEIGCKISWPKSLQSSRLAEFAGKLILPDAVLPQMKYRNISDDSFLDLAKTLGPRSRWLLKPKQRLVLDKIASVPECLGGFGWNPQGLPLKDRLQAWVFDDPAPVDRSTGDTKKQVRNLMVSSYVSRTASWWEGEFYSHFLQEDTLVQRARSLVHSISPGLVPLVGIMGKNLDMVIDDVDLPIESPNSAKRPTTLDVWLRRLGLHH